MSKAGCDKMNSKWQIDLFTSLNNASNVQDVLDCTLKITKRFGFDYCGLRTELPIPLSKKRTLALNTNENDQVKDKIEEGHYDETPVVKHCSRSIEPFFWTGRRDDKVFLQIPELAEEYQSSGRFGGWAQSLIETKQIYSIFWVDTSAPVLQKDIEHVNFEMEWIATSALIKMNQIKLQSDIILSEREKEVLRWFGDGKTANDIGQILHLSHSTVNFHLRNAMYKLDAKNKTSAVVKAIYLNLLH